MRNIVLVIGYDGTGYSGFQTQPSGNTVQDKVEATILNLTGEKLKIHGSGRTDAGVHARAQVVHFHTESKIPIERWCLALNSRLPDDIVVYRAWEAPLEFHARRSAKRKTYRYTIQRSKFPDLFHRTTRLHHPMPLDISAMREGLAMLEGEHDFTSFCSVRSDKECHVRHLYETHVHVDLQQMPGDNEAEVIQIEMTSNGFLYNMVRIVVGTLIQVGEGKRRPEDMLRILEAKSRSAAGPTAPAFALTLWDVQY